VTTSADCLNCGAALTGRYCSACGQKADVSIPSLTQLLADAFGDLFNFDSRLWRSLLALAFKPGRLTRYYLAGRARATRRRFACTSWPAWSFSRLLVATPGARTCAGHVVVAGVMKLLFLFARRSLFFAVLITR